MPRSPGGQAARRRRHRYARVYSALGDPTRLQLLERLGADGPCSIAALTDGTPITRQAISRHLRTLEQAGLVRSSHEGRECLWSPRPDGLREARAHIARISSHWDEALQRLRSQVESPP